MTKIFYPNLNKLVHEVNEICSVIKDNKKDTNLIENYLHNCKYENAMYYTKIFTKLKVRKLYFIHETYGKNYGIFYILHVSNGKDSKLYYILMKTIQPTLTELITDNKDMKILLSK